MSKFDPTGYYNGYSSRERGAKGAWLNRLVAAGRFPVADPPCQLCGDPAPNSGVEYHSEDYSRPFEPIEYALCRTCHRQWLHKRFSKPYAWEIFKQHVARGGYARDLQNPEIRREFDAAAESSRNGALVSLDTLRDRPPCGDEWWMSLSTACLHRVSFDSRPRADQDIRRALDEALSSITENQLRLFQHHYTAQGRTASMGALASSVGYVNYGSANLQYGRAAHTISDVCDYDPPKRNDGSSMFMWVLAHPGPQESDQDFTWTMNRSFARALERCQLV